jgi:hypothetical protein
MKSHQDPHSKAQYYLFYNKENDEGLKRLASHGVTLKK